MKRIKEKLNLISMNEKKKLEIYITNILNNPKDFTVDEVVKTLIEHIIKYEKTNTNTSS